MSPNLSLQVAGCRLSDGEAPRRQPANLRLLITGTFNLIVKDRIAFPPERRAFSPDDSRTKRLSLSSNFMNLSRAREGCQLTETTGLPQFLHREGADDEPRYFWRQQSGRRRRSPSQPYTKCCTSNDLRATKRDFRDEWSGLVRHAPRRKRSNLIKDRLEVLAKPFEELCPRMRTPWPG